MGGGEDTPCHPHPLPTRTPYRRPRPARALPPPLLGELDTDFSAERRAGLRALVSHPAGKLAFHAARRFWEEDAAIYGGISWTTSNATQIWYPSHGLGGAGGGVLVGTRTVLRQARG